MSQENKGKKTSQQAKPASQKVKAVKNTQPKTKELSDADLDMVAGGVTIDFAAVDYFIKSDKH